MNKKQAANIILQATNLLKLTYSEHLSIQQAVQILMEENKVETIKENKKGKK